MELGEAFWVALSATRTDYHGTHLFSVMQLSSALYLRPKRYSYIFGVATHPNAIGLHSQSHMIKLIAGSWSDFEMENGEKPLEGTNKEGWLVSAYMGARVMARTIVAAQSKMSKL